MLHWPLATLLLFVLTTTSWALDLKSIDRTIKKEPAYRSQPRYCLLAFGKDAEKHVWLAIDGRRLYIDRDGNGDLTDPDEVVIASEGGKQFNVKEIRGTDDLVHTDFQLTLHEHDQFYCYLKLDGAEGRSVGGTGTHPKPRFGVRPQEAPIIHFNGPLTFAPYGRFFFISRTKKITGNSTLRVSLGSAGLGEGTFAKRGFKAWLGRTDSHFVNVDFEFPSRTPEGKPIIRRDRLRIRGAGSYGYCSNVWAEENTGPGYVKITISMPEWKKDDVLPCTYKLMIIGARQDLPTLASAIQTEDEVFREKAARVVRHRGYDSADEEVLKLLVEQFASVDPQSRARAVRGLTEWKTTQVSKLLTVALADPNSGVRVAAIHALRGHRKQATVLVPQLMNALADREVKIRRAAALELQSFAPHSDFTVEVLYKLLSDPDATIRVNALAALAVDDNSSSESASRMAPLLQDENPTIRKAAASAIATINHAAIGPLIGKLKSIPSNHEIVQELAAKALDSMGAGLNYNEAGKVTYITFYEPPHVDARKINDDDLVLLQHCSAIDELSELTSISFRETRITDKALVHIKDLNQLTALDLTNVLITAAAMKHIQNLKQLTYLGLSGTRVDGDGLNNLAGLTKLTRLKLGSTKITDVDLNHLAELTSLESLQLDDTAISNDGLSAIQNLTELNFLSIGGTKIDDEGLVHLKKLAGLSHLKLDRTCISPSGLSHLSHLQKLRILDLSQTNVDDSAIENLVKLKGLRKLYLRKTMFTVEGIGKLRSLMPKLQSLNFY